MWVPWVGTNVWAALHFRRILNISVDTCEQVYSVEYLRFINAIFQKVVSLQVLVVISKNDLIFEVDKIRRNHMIVDDLICDFCEEEVEVNVVFFIEVFVDWLCLKKGTVDCVPSLFHLAVLFE